MNSLSLKLGLRFFNSKRKAALSRFMSFASTAGIAVGVFALIVGLSAMNGFERELHERVLAVIPSAQIKAQHGYFTDAENFAAALTRQPGISAAVPALMLEAVFSNGRDFVPAALYGIDPSRQEQVTAIGRFLSVKLSALQTAKAAADSAETTATALPAILGRGIVRRLGLRPGDEFYLYASIPDNSGMAAARLPEKEAQLSTTLFKSPRSLRLKLAGELAIGGQLDSAVCFTQLGDTLKTLNLNGANQIQIKTADLLNARQLAYSAAAATAREPCYVESWLSSQGKLYHDIQMIRGIMYLAMILVMAVACFNIVSNLVMAVSEKKREIAILLTMGAPRSLIVSSFCCMGLLSGLKGTLLGLCFAIPVALGLTPLSSGLEQLLGIKILNEEIYFINFIPSRLEPLDVLLVFACALGMSLIASIYPALRASRISPALELNA